MEQVFYNLLTRITYKIINGKRYPYYQWTDKETGKQRNRIVKPDELEELGKKIKERQDLYIRCGGTMSLGGVDYNSSGMAFAIKPLISNSQ